MAQKGIHDPTSPGLLFQNGNFKLSHFIVLLSGLRWEALAEWVNIHSHNFEGESESQNENANTNSLSQK